MMKNNKFLHEHEERLKTEFATLLVDVLKHALVSMSSSVMLLSKERRIPHAHGSVHNVIDVTGFLRMGQEVL